MNSSRGERKGSERYGVADIQLELQQIAGRDEPTLEVPIAESPEDVERYRERVAKQLDILEQRFGEAMEGTKFHGYLRIGALVVSIVLVLVGAVIMFFFPEKQVGNIGTFTAGTGLVGAVSWIMSFILSSRKQDIGLTLTIARYKVQLAACNSIAGIQQIADEVAKVLAEMA